MLRAKRPSGMVSIAVFGMYEYNQTYDEKLGFYAGPAKKQMRLGAIYCWRPAER